jgi:glutamine synthetase
LPGEDANPDLTLALLLGTGLMGMQQQMEPSAARSTRAANSRVTGSIAAQATKTKKPRFSR